MILLELQEKIALMIKNDKAIGHSEVIVSHMAYDPNKKAFFKDSLPIRSVAFKGLADKNVVILS